MAIDSTDVIAQTKASLALHGLCLIGGFHPTDAELEGARTVLLVGNAGSTMWQRIDPKPDDPKDHAIDIWTRGVLEDLAIKLGARALYPSDGPPYAPFVSWTFRTGQCHASRLGMAIHQQFGLWFALRGALLFDEKIEMAIPDTASPCDSCADKPCVSACPVGAFDGESYAHHDCRSYVARRPNGCAAQGCAARRACPVGHDFQYQPDHAAYHMRSFAP